MPEASRTNCSLVLAIRSSRMILERSMQSLELRGASREFSQGVDV